MGLTSSTPGQRVTTVTTHLNQPYAAGTDVNFFFFLSGPGGQQLQMMLQDPI
jgi:hypothetical protein